MKDRYGLADNYESVVWSCGDLNLGNLFNWQTESDDTFPILCLRYSHQQEATISTNLILHVNLCCF
jgi:hypothetical protein